MRVATPHIGVEPCAGAKTDVMGFPRVVVECLLALAQRTRGRAAIEIVDLYEVAKAVASEPPRGLHTDGPADAGLEGLLGLRQAVGTHEVIEVLQFWIPPTPREIKKLNVSPTLYCNVLPLTVYFIGILMY